MSHVSYHFRTHEELGCIEEVASRQVRGATEHFYEPRTTALAWTKEWERLGSHVKQAFSASVLGRYVEVVGNAIDDGSFENRPDSHLSWDTLRLDLSGWHEVTRLLDETLERVMKIETDAEDRISAPDAGFGSAIGRVPECARRESNPRPSA